MVRVDLLDSVRGLKTLLGGYFKYFNLISCLNVSHKFVEYRLVMKDKDINLLADFADHSQLKYR